VALVVGLSVLLVAGHLAFRFSCYELYRMPSTSMAPSLVVGDHFFVNKLTYGIRLPFGSQRYFPRLPERGDVIVFTPPGDPAATDHVKRVIGLPGERVDVRDRHVFINGAPLESTAPTPLDLDGNGDRPRDQKQGAVPRYLEFEETAGAHHYPVLESPNQPVVGTQEGTWTVLPGHVFVLGDNRDNSLDSRFDAGPNGYGQVPLSAVKGRVGRIWLSYGGERGLRTSRMGAATP